MNVNNIKIVLKTVGTYECTTTTVDRVFMGENADQEATKYLIDRVRETERLNALFEASIKLIHAWQERNPRHESYTKQEDDWCARAEEYASQVERDLGLTHPEDIPRYHLEDSKFEVVHSS